MTIQPFQINIPQATLDDLQQRLARTRWPDEGPDDAWNAGANLAYMQALVKYWQTHFDWRQQEARLNHLPQFKAQIDGLPLHFIHQRGKGATPLPLLLLHGWPDSFYRFHKIIPMLTDPVAHGGDAADAFDVVAPSIPGYGFSSPLGKGVTGESVVAGLVQLMTQTLGYPHFAVHGGDVGSGLTEQIALHHADVVVGIHLTDIPYWHVFTMAQEDLSAAEQQYLAAGQAWGQREGAYAMLQSTKPQTLAYGLNDSPVGLAAWIVEKFHGWSDNGGDLERCFSKDELLTNIMLYWVTETINSSFRPYYGGPQPSSSVPAARVETPTGVASFPKDLVPAPRDFAERFFNIQHWTEMPRGGHFAALEEPELLVDNLRAFFRPLRKA